MRPRNIIRTVACALLSGGVFALAGLPVPALAGETWSGRDSGGGTKFGWIDDSGGYYEWSSKKGISFGTVTKDSYFIKHLDGGVEYGTITRDRPLSEDMDAPGLGEDD